MGALASALAAVTAAVRRARSASWSSLQLTLHNGAPLPDDVAADIARLKAADYDAEPPPIKVRSLGFRFFNSN